jgi:hypothetical protein
MKNLNCCNCGTKFAMEDSIYADRLEDGGIFTCPNGHKQHFTESENKKLRDKVAKLERLLRMAREQRDNNKRWYEGCERRLSATKGVVTKLKMKLYPDRYEQ